MKRAKLPILVTPCSYRSFWRLNISCKRGSVEQNFHAIQFMHGMNLMEWWSDFNGNGPGLSHSSNQPALRDSCYHSHQHPIKFTSTSIQTGKVCLVSIAKIPVHNDHTPEGPGPILLFMTWVHGMSKIISFYSTTPPPQVHSQAQHQ